jgi:hypothetical protein
MAEENIVIKIKADIGITKEVIEAVTKAMEGLGKTATIVSGNVKVTNKNLEDTNKILGQVAQTAGKTTGAIGGAGDAVKKSNQQWTNLALVIQDLPYGFRGIQNNLPALIGGFAGVTGGIYFAVSAVIAFFTAYDNGAFGAKKSTDAWAESVKKANDELKASLDYSNTSTQKLKGLISIGNDYTQSEETRVKILKEVKDELGKVNKIEADKIKNMGDATMAVGAYTEAIKAQNIAEITGKRLAELEIQQLKDRAVVLASSGKGIKPLEWFGLTQSDADAAKLRITQTVGEIRLLEQVQATALKGSLINPYSEFNKPDDNKKEVTQANQRVKLENETNLQVLQSKQQTYKDDILLFKDYEIKIIDLQEQQALAEAKALGASELVLQNIRDIAANNRLKARQDLSAKIKKLIEDDVKEEEKAEKEKERINKDFISAFKSDLNQQESDFSQFYKTRMDLSTGDLEGQKEILLQQRAQLEEGLVLQAISWDTYTKGVGENVKAVANISAKISKQAFDSLMQMGNGIMNALGPSLDMLIEKGENIGEVLTSAFHSIIRQLAKVIISAGIAVGLMAILFPGMLAKAGGAGAVFKGLIGQGMGIGGIIGGGNGTKGVDATKGSSAINTIQSGQTEESNGQFVLKGNDLVLALQRSNSSLNLRRGGI